MRTAFILFSVLQHIQLLSQEHLPRDPSLAPLHSPPRGLECSADPPLPGIQKLHFQPLFLAFSVTTSQFSVSLFFSCLFLPSPAHESPPCSTLEHSLSLPWAWGNSCKPQASLRITPIAIICALVFDAFANSFSQITLGNPSATVCRGKVNFPSLFPLRHGTPDVTGSVHQKLPCHSLPRKPAFIPCTLCSVP